MKIILSNNVDNLGKMGDVVAVANGYARNYLIPKKLAVEANARGMGQLQHIKSVIDRKIKKEKQRSEEVARQISQLCLTFNVRSGEEGKLFGSIGVKNILEELARQGFDFTKKEILLEKPIKELGVFFLPVKIQHDVTSSLKIEVLPLQEENKEE